MSFTATCEIQYIVVFLVFISILHNILRFLDNLTFIYDYVIISLQTLVCNFIKQIFESRPPMMRDEPKSKIFFIGDSLWK